MMHITYVFIDLVSGDGVRMSANEGILRWADKCDLLLSRAKRPIQGHISGIPRDLRFVSDKLRNKTNDATCCEDKRTAKPKEDEAWRNYNRRRRKQ